MEMRGEDLGSSPFLQPPSSNSIRRMIKTLLLTLLPSFVLQSPDSVNSSTRSTGVDDTRYLDGVRGIAAMVVVFQHMTQHYYTSIFLAGDQLIQLPFIRLLISGQFAVHVFFILSGFVLSIGPLTSAHSGRHDHVLNTLPSRIFRRPLRLMLPLLPIVVATSLLIELGWLYGSDNKLIPPSGSVVGQLAQGMRSFLWTAWGPFRFDSERDDAWMATPNWQQAWTLPREFRGSMVVYLCCTQCRVAPWLRTAGWVVFSVSCLSQGYWDMAMFLAGMVLAEIRILKGTSRWRRWCGSKHSSPLIRRCVSVFWVGVLMMGLYFGGWPEFMAEGSRWYGNFTNWPIVGHSHMRCFLSVSAFGVLLSLEQIPALQRFCSSPAVQYFGKISYGLYLTHWMVIFTVGKATIESLRGHGYGEFGSFMTGATLAVMLSIWIGDVYWRAVDVNCIKIAAWVARILGV